jgi:hypothetical protein
MAEVATTVRNRLIRVFIFPCSVLIPIPEF